MLNVKDWLKSRQAKQKAQFSPLYTGKDNGVVQAVMRISDNEIFRVRNLVAVVGEGITLYPILSFCDDYINVEIGGHTFKTQRPINKLVKLAEISPDPAIDSNYDT